MPLSRLEYLFNCFIERTCSFEEEKELMQLLADPKNEREIKCLLDDLIAKTSSETKVNERSAALILKNIAEGSQNIKSRDGVRVSFSRVAAAAVVILIISGLSYWLISKPKFNKKLPDSSLAKADAPKIKPGGTHAILTMGDGSTIELDSVQNTSIQRGSVKIIKQSGLLVYNGSGPLKAGMPVTYNTLTTPRGGEYKLELSDGSKVWLNASSSLRFPTAFTGKERSVELTGEAYFEVAKNKEKPFHVNVNGLQVQVLGTHFNINAYEDECAIKTSLLEGRVEIKKGDISGFLHPGQQGVIKKNSKKLKIRDADMNQVIAWKNGLFQFDGADIKDIMRQIGRWYDVEVEYVGKIPKRRFAGKISRGAQLQDVLKILEFSNVKFSVQGKKIVVQ
jgi:hypothetical protein